MKTPYSYEDVSEFWDALYYFFRARNLLDRKFREQKKTKRITFSRFDDIVELLSKARLASHELFRDRGQKMQRPDDPGQLFDFVVSTIYHEVLHIKEYVYIIDTYGQFYGDADTKGEAFDESLLKWVNRYTTEIYKHAQSELPASFTNVSRLFDSCVNILQYLLPTFRETSLGRIAYCNRAHQTREFFVKRPVVRFFELMYEGGGCEGFYHVAESMFKEGFHLEGVKAGQHAWNGYQEEPNEQNREWMLKLKTALESIDYKGKIRQRLLGKLSEL